MILYLLIFYFFGVSLATNISSKNSSTTNSSTTHNTNSSSHDFTKKILCNFKGNMDESDSTLIDLDPKKLPKECDIITYSRFSINIYAQIDCDEDLLKSVTDLNKPVLVALQRDYYYIDWVSVFSANDTNPSNEVKVLCDFAKSHNIMGYIVKSVAPEYSVIGFNEDVGKKIVPYIKQLKQCNLVIGLAIYAAPSAMKNPCVYNYEELNNIVDFYKIETFQLNQVCDPNIYNGLTPISKSDHGPNYYYGMEEVVSYLKETKISLTKLVFDIEMYPYDSSTTTYNSYAQVCSGKFDNSTWCVQTSLDFYNKGKFVHDQNAGVLVAIMDLDDVNNDCACTAAFNGFKNIYAGYTGGSTSPCQHFDVQSFEYLIK